MTMEIRKAVRDEAPAIWELKNASILAQCAACYPREVLDLWTAGEMPPGFADDVERSFYAAFRKGTLVGSGKVDLESAKIDAVFVHPQHFRTGVGKKMLRYLERLAREAGLKELHLESTLNAAAFYRAQGFRGEELGVYESPRGVTLPCVPMTKTLREE
jgi:GNAT superfamily N-acetyltransferase